MEIDPRLRSDTSPGSQYPPLHRPPGPAPTQIAANPNRPPQTQLYHSAHDGPQQSGFPPQTPQSIGDTGFASADLHGGDGSPEARQAGLKRPRACEACRGLKVRCEFDVNNMDGPCRRCAKANRNCVVTVPTRKRQKKTDSRVAELEKKIDALTASLQASKSRSISVGHGSEGEEDHDTPNDTARPNSYEQVTVGEFASAFEQRTGNDWAPSDRHSRILEGDGKPLPPPMVIAGQKRKYQEGRDFSIATITPISVASAGSAGQATSTHPYFYEPAQNATTSKGNAPHEYADLIDRGAITMEVATQIFNRYVNEMSPHMPFIIFPPGTAAADIRKSKPTLFLAILSAGSGTNSEIQRILTKEVMHIYATKIICNGEKTLELIQALLINTVWYWPPEHFEELKFYQLVHLAAVMAIDLNIGKKNKPSKARTAPIGLWRDNNWRKNPFPDPEALECRRLWLTCYFLCCSTSTGLRRPNLVRWTPYMAECIEILETSPDAAPSDKFLCQLVRSQKIAEEVGTQFSMDDPLATVSISEPKVQYALKGFERDLQLWSEHVPEDVRTPTLTMTQHLVSLYMHEVALHVDHNVEEFKPPFTEENLTIRDPEQAGIPLAPAHIAALSTCLTSIDGIFDSFLSLDVETIRTLPILHFVRIAYAIVVLIKMYFAASTPNSELGKVILKENMKVEFNLDRLIEKFRATAAEDKCRPASKFLMVLVMLKTWFNRSKTGKPHPKSDFCTMGQQPQDDVLAPTPGPQTIIQHEQLQKNDYSPANTPLQLLSEVATSSNPSQASRPQSCNQYPPNTGSEWHPSHQHQQQASIYGNSNSSSQIHSGFAPGPTTYSNIDPSLGVGIEFDFPVGDGFEQAMGLTLGEGDFQKYFVDDGWLGAIVKDTVAGSGVKYPFDVFS